MNSKDEIIEILMRRDNLTRNEADNLMDNFFDEVEEYEDPSEIEDLFTYYFSLEPDYLDMIINEI